MTDLPNQARRGTLLRDEPQTIVSIRKPWSFVAVRWTGSRPNLGNASSALRIYANETNCEAHCSFRRTGVAVRISCSEQPATRSLLLTPNIANERRRSAQHGGVRSIGWLGDEASPVSKPSSLDDAESQQNKWSSASRGFRRSDVRGAQ